MQSLVRRIRRSAGLGFAVAVVACLLAGGCTAFSDHRAGLAGDYASGWYDKAAKELDDPKTAELYGSKNRLLYLLDRGAVALALGDYEKTIDLLNQAEEQIDRQREKSLGDKIGQWTINDTTSTYVAEPYEDMYTNVIKIMAQFGANNIQGGATVEARRIGSKADLLRDQYLKYKDQIQKDAKSKLGSAPPSAQKTLGLSNDDGEFVESPLGTYLAAVAFMKSGDPELQRVAGKRLIGSIELQGPLIGPVKQEDFADIEEKPANSVNVLVVALSGRGPTKYAEKVGPIPLGTFPVYFELPKLQTHPSQVSRARIEVEGESAALSELKLIEDMSAVAAENHRRQLPLIYTRTLIRAGLRAGISATATEIARKNAHDANKELIVVGGAIAGLVVQWAMERADLRSWIFLPGQARVGLYRLNPGQHRVRVIYEGGPGGILYTTEWRTMNVTENGLASVVMQYWN